MAYVRYSGTGSANLGTKNITSNGNYAASADGLDGFSSVDVAVPGPVLGNKNIVDNGLYTASSDNLDGYSSVNVNVPEAILGTKSITANGDYVAIDDNLNGYSSVSVEVPGPDLGTKSITTNGTYNASSDNLDGYRTVNVSVPTTATLITKNITMNGTYNAASEQADGYSSVTVDVPTTALDVTPSNTIPPHLYANVPANPTSNGYAIESYDSVTPSSTAVSIASGDMIKVNGSGVIVDSVPTPQSITPSNSTPATMVSGGLYSSTANGKAVASITEVTPSSTNPPFVSTSEVYKVNNYGYVYDHAPYAITPSNIIPYMLLQDIPMQPTEVGYAIESYTYVTPSDSSPTAMNGNNTYIVDPNVGTSGTFGYIIQHQPTSKTPSDSSPAAVTANSIIKPTAAGYLYSSSGLGKCKAGTATLSTSNTTTVTLGFTPKYISVLVYKDSTHYNQSVYDEHVSSSQTVRSAKNGSTVASTTISLPTTSSSATPAKILSISNTGFVIDVATTVAGTSAYYFAIG